MKLLQWNIWYKEDIKNILDTLKTIDADVICLQELTVNNPQYNQDIDTSKYIAEGLGFEYFFKEAQTDAARGREEKLGNGIFSRFPIKKTAFHYIQEPLDPNIENSDYSKEGRIYNEISVDAAGREISIGTAHMSYTDRFAPSPAKQAETDKLLEILRTKTRDFIFTGDLNALPGSYTINEVSKLLKNCGPAFEENTWTTKPFLYRGFDANTLDWRLDYCFATHDIEVISAKVVDTPFSDHLPILIEI